MGDFEGAKRFLLGEISKHYIAEKFVDFWNFCYDWEEEEGEIPSCPLPLMPPPPCAPTDQRQDFAMITPVNNTILATEITTQLFRW